MYDLDVHELVVLLSILTSLDACHQNVSSLSDVSPTDFESPRRSRLQPFRVESLQLIRKQSDLEMALQKMFPKCVLRGPSTHLSARKELGFWETNAK